MSDERCGHNARHDDVNYDRVDIAAGLSILYYVDVSAHPSGVVYVYMRGGSRAHHAHIAPVGRRSPSIKAAYGTHSGTLEGGQRAVSSLQKLFIGGLHRYPNHLPPTLVWGSYQLRITTEGVHR